MNFIQVAGWCDTAVLLVIVWCAVDGSRMVAAERELLRALAYYCTAVGTVAYVFYRQFDTWQEATATLFQHTGFMIYAITHIMRRIRETRYGNFGHPVKRHHWGFGKTSH